MTRSETEFLHKMARRYCWEMQDDATVLPEHVARRVMDLGVFDDALALEATVGRPLYSRGRRLAPCDGDPGGSGTIASGSPTPTTTRRRCRPGALADGNALRHPAGRTETPSSSPRAAAPFRLRPLRGHGSCGPALFPGFPALEAIRALVYFGDGDLASLSYADRATLIAHADHAAAPVAMSIVSERLAGP